MEMHSRTLPYGSLPYDQTLPTARVIVKLFENIPYIPYLPCIEDLSVLERTLMGIPGVAYRDGSFMLLKDFNKFKTIINQMDQPFNTQTDLNKYVVYPALWVDYLHIIKVSKPKQAIINLIGPISIAEYLKREEHPNLLANKYGRKFLIQAIAIKAMSYIKLVKNVLPEIEPLIILEDNGLSSLGLLKRDNFDITNEVIGNIYTKIIDKIHESGANVCIQCFNKCDWNIPIDAGVDMISFDAYTNPNNLCIISKKINEFLAHGGYINWAIVPVKNETMVRQLNIANLYNHFQKTIENLINEGVSAKLAYNHSTVSVQGNLNDLPVMFAEKALIMSVQLGKKIPILK